MNYEEFIQNKQRKAHPSGFDIDRLSLNHHMMEFQKDITQWAIKVGRAAIFAECGLGKTLCELEWARHINMATGKPVLLFAPLAVSLQMIDEGKKFGIAAKIVESDDDIFNGINITNYEKIHHFKSSVFSGVILDESSILKGYLGKTRHILNEFVDCIPYRLCATATPAPNDLIEIINHAEFLGVMSVLEIRALFFTQDGNSSTKFRLRHHAVKDFWEWVGTWAIALRKPSDLGYSDDGFILPPLEIENIVVETELKSRETLFAMEAVTLSDQSKARQLTVLDRSRVAADLVNNSEEQWAIWCDLNYESECVSNLIFDAVEVKGSDSMDWKENALIGFSKESYRVIVTKPSIAGFGMNWQNCHNVVCLGLSHSYERLYQLIRRFYRFGQRMPVKVYLITSDMDGAVLANIERKEHQSNEMYNEIIRYMMRNHRVNRESSIINGGDIFNDEMQCPEWLNSHSGSYENLECLRVDYDNIYHFLGGKEDSICDNSKFVMELPGWISK